MNSLVALEDKMSKSGFSLIELLIVISIIAIIGRATIPLGANFLVSNHLENKTNEIVASLRTAQTNTLAGKENNQWGLYIDNSQIIMFKGSSYSAPGTVFDHKYDLPSSISINPDSLEIVFNKLTGSPSSTSTITITSNNNKTNIINLNEVGTVNVN